jgi:hypothetical protein
MLARAMALVVFAIVSPHTAAPGPEFGRTFEIKAAELVTIQELRITFVGLSEDSRCPTGTQCVWAGDAAATFTLETPRAAAEQRTLHTNGRFERQTDFADFVVRLEDVKPYPREGVAIDPGDYRAAVVVTRR